MARSDKHPDGLKLFGHPNALKLFGHPNALKLFGDEGWIWATREGTTTSSDPSSAAAPLLPASHAVQQ